MWLFIFQQAEIDFFGARHAHLLFIQIEFFKYIFDNFFFFFLFKPKRFKKNVSIFCF